MAIEKVIDIKIQGNADEAVGSLRSQLRAAQAEVAELSNKFGATSQQAVEAAKRAGQLKDQIGDAKALTDAFNPDAKFKSLSASLAGVAGGFAVVQGGMALLGTESKDVEKTLLKVQAAMALSQGLQTIGESVDSFKQLGAVVKSYTIVQRVSTVLQAAFNAVMAANPIGAIVVAVTALVAAGYALVKMFQASSEETKRSEQAHKSLTKELKTQVEAQKNATIEADLSRDAQLKMAKASGKSADEIRKLSVELANQEVAQKIANAQTLRAIAIEAIRVANLEDASESQKELAKNALKEFNDANEAAKTALINRRKLLIDNKVAETQEQTDLTTKANEKSKEAADKKAEKEKEARKKQREDYLKDAEDLEALKAKLEQNRLDKEAEVKKKADEIQQGLKDNALTPAERLQKKYDEERAILEAAHQSTLLLDAKFYTDKKALDNADIENKKANAETAIELAKKEAAAKVALMDKTASVLSKGADLLGKNTAAGKAMSIAAATINTYQGITAELATKTVTPFEIGLKIANVALIAATGLKAVKDIISVKVPGGGGGGAAPSMSGAGAGGGAAPQFNVVGNSGVNQLAGIMATNEQTPVKAYVVPSDVTTGQSLDRNIIRNASLG
jgi:myosin heavy subunit